MSPFEPAPQKTFDPVAIVTSCIESGARSILFDFGTLSGEFFDLSTGVAGTLLHRLTLYRIRLAAVVPDLTPYSDRFRDLAVEGSRGSDFRFFPDRAEALQWLKENEDE